MEAPEKIQVHLMKNNCDDWSIEGYSFLEDKQIGMTEYTRTDAFIEKAEKYLLEHLIDYWSQVVTDESDFIEGFKNYMKGE